MRAVCEICFCKRGFSVSLVYMFSFFDKKGRVHHTRQKENSRRIFAARMV
jgi:hypothetical protein